ncbi:hypothetical protein BH10PSE19_BH10PSE19_11020 [soil metagenome]
MHAKVAERGQVTIPKLLRKQLGIGPNTILDFKIKNGMLVAVKTDQQDAVAQVYGCLKLAFDTDSLILELRGDEE